MSSEIIEALAARFLPQKRKVIAGTVASVLVAVLLVTAYAALVFSAWFWLVPVYGPAAACLLIAAASIVLVPIVLAINWAFVGLIDRRRRRKMAAAPASAEAETEAELANLAATALPVLMRKNPIVTVSLVAGMSYLMTKSKNE